MKNQTPARDRRRPFRGRGGGFEHVGKILERVLAEAEAREKQAKADSAKNE